MKTFTVRTDHSGSPCVVYKNREHYICANNDVRQPDLVHLELVLNGRVRKSQWAKRGQEAADKTIEWMKEM